MPAMAALWRFLRISIVGFTAFLLSIVRRLLRGPLVEGWSWSAETRRAVLAAVIRSAVGHDDPRLWSDVVITSPMPLALRRRSRIEPGRSGGVEGEWIRMRDRPPQRPTILYFHGGGYVMGHPRMERPFIARLAVQAGVDAFSADYRLAPRHPFPAALDDAHACYRGLLADGHDPSSLVLVGDSAGGGLATALLVRLRDEGGALPCGAVLFSPWVDLANTASTIDSNAATDYLPVMAGSPALEYLGGADSANPYASPLNADLTGLPPLLVMAGGVEMILEDSTRLVSRAQEQGVETTLVIESDMYHVWPVVLPRDPASARAIETAAAWIRQRTVVD